MASVFEILSKNNYDPLNPVESLIANEKAKLGQSTYVPYTEDFQFGTSESPTQTIYNPRKLELEAEKSKLNSDVKDEFAEKNLAIKNEILASQKAEEGVKQQALHDKLQNDRIDAIANQSDAVKFTEKFDAEKAAASSVFMSNYNDDQVFTPNLEEALNNEILNTSDKDLKIASGVAFEAAQKEAKKNAEKLMDEMKEDNRRNMSIEEEEQLYLNQNNGLDYHETLGKKIEEETGLPPQGAIFTSTDDIPDTFTLPDGEVVSSVGVDYIEQLRQRKETERKEKEALMEAVSEKLKYTDDGRLISEMTDEEKSIHALEQGYNDAGQDQDFIDAKNKALKEREKALRTTNEIADEKLIEKARLEKLRQEEVARVEAKHNRNEGQDAFSGQGTDAVDPIKNQRGILDRINEERKGGESEATKLRQNQDFANSLDAEQKLMQEKALHERQINSETADNVSANFDKDRNHYRKMQAIKKTAADVNASENAFQEDNGAVNVRSMMRGAFDDPYHFTTLAYPPEAVSSQENGHFMLFYVNVQNKTKYSYDGMSNGKIIKVGDYIERPGYFTEGTGGPAGGGSRYITSVEASGTGANAGDVDYQKQMVRNGGKGNIIYNNQSILQKSRKLPKSGINSRYQTTTRITDSVALYLPSGIGNTTSASYGDFQTGVAGYLAMSGLDIVSELQNRDFRGAAEKIFGVGGTLITEAAKKLAVAGIETFTGSEGIQQSIDKAFGQTLNPYIEVAFNSTGMRTFDYTFKFAPKSRAETDEVKAIIQLFRFHMLPEMKSQAHRYLTLPSTFDIHYMWQNGRTTAGENSFYNKIATCVLTNVDINYTPNGEVQSFGDGAPTQIDMNLSFKETEMLTKQHIQEGF